jgi:hypothetical protein
MIGIWCRLGQAAYPRLVQSIVRCTGRTSSLTTTISKTSGVALCLRSSGWGVRSKDHSRVSVGVITQDRIPGCGQSRIPVCVLRVEMSRHEDWEPSAQALGQVRLDQRSCGQEVGCHEVHSSGRQHLVYGSSLQVLQARDWHSIMIYASTDKDQCAFSSSRAFRTVACKVWKF